MSGQRTLFDDAYRYALFLSRDRGVAEELVQDAWRAVLAAGGPQEKPYLLRAVRSRWIDRGRRPRLVVVGEPDILSREPVASDPWSSRALWSAVSELGEEERETLLLMVVEGWTGAEVAEHMGRSRNTVLSWLRRARSKLRTALERPEESA